MKSLVLTIVGVAILSQTRSNAAVSSVTYIPSTQVTAAFDKGMPMLETPGYKIHASRREAPGMAEIHTRDTDIIYVLQGTATIITGGDAVDPKMTATDEFRGSGIKGGESRQLSKGDVFVIPNGVPHLFKETSSPFLYYVVKATAPAAGGTE